jgi:hypothetical protein
MILCQESQTSDSPSAACQDSKPHPGRDSASHSRTVTANCSPMSALDGVIADMIIPPQRIGSLIGGSVFRESLSSSTSGGRPQSPGSSRPTRRLRGSLTFGSRPIRPRGAVRRSNALSRSTSPDLASPRRSSRSSAKSGREDARETRSLALHPNTSRPGFCFSLTRLTPPTILKPITWTSHRQRRQTLYPGGTDMTWHMKQVQTLPPELVSRLEGAIASTPREGARQYLAVSPG